MPTLDGAIMLDEDGALCPLEPCDDDEGTLDEDGSALDEEPGPEDGGSALLADDETSSLDDGAARDDEDVAALDEDGTLLEAWLDDGDDAEDDGAPASGNPPSGTGSHRVALSQ